MEKPVYLVLHGLNGGSHEEYVKDLVERRRAEGSTIIVLIARGMMDTKMVGWNVFHGARTGDVDIAARSVRRGLESLSKAKNQQQRKQRQVLVGVGYSMGAIILSNYVARSGEHCALDAAMAISGKKYFWSISVSCYAFVFTFYIRVMFLHINSFFYLSKVGWICANN